MQHFVLVINCGSSSLKFAVINPQTGETPVKGNASQLNQKIAHLRVANAEGEYEKTFPLPEPGEGHARAMQQLVEVLEREGVMAMIRSVGHRIVHGGEYFSESVLVNDEVRDKIADCSRLAPLHNPAHVVGIDAAKKIFPFLPQVVVFDTAFHHKMPEKAYLYALPYRFYKEFHIRRYGFHGTSYRYIASQLPAVTGMEHPKAIVCHLGNGGSVAAIDGDHSLDTTMGLTPLEGIVHGTRSGDIDPAIPRILTDQFDINVHEVGDILWRRSGLLGLSQITNDCHKLQVLHAEGNKAATRALEVYCYRLAKYIAGQVVALNGFELMVFTGGIGENSSFVRARTIEQLQFLGLAIDAATNDATIGGKTGKISTPESKPIWVIPTNEELMIAQDAERLTAPLMD